MSCPESQESCCSPACRSKLAYFIAILVVFLVVGGLAKMLQHYTETGSQAAREAVSYTHLTLPTNREV